MTKEEFKECVRMAFVRRGTWEQFFEELWQLHVQAQWISVEDEMPEELGWYLIYGASHNLCYWNDVCYWDGKRWWRNVYNITHWMPLPDPPIVSKKEKIGKDSTLDRMMGDPMGDVDELINGTKGGEQ